MNMVSRIGFFHHPMVRKIFFSITCFLLTAPVYAAGWGQKIANKLEEVNADLKIIAGVCGVTALITLGLLHLFGIEHNFKGKILSFVVAMTIIFFAKEIVDFFIN